MKLIITTEVSEDNKKEALVIASRETKAVDVAS